MKNVCCVELGTQQKGRVYLSVTRTGQCVLSAGSAGQRQAAPPALLRPVSVQHWSEQGHWPTHSPQILGHNSMFLSLHSELQDSTEYNKEEVYSVQSSVQCPAINPRSGDQATQLLESSQAAHNTLSGIAHCLGIGHCYIPKPTPDEMMATLDYGQSKMR